MRLLTRTTLYFLLAMVPLLFATGYFLFKQFSNQINEQADKELVYEEVQWIQYLEATTTGNSNFILRSPDLLIYPTEKEPATYPTIATITVAVIKLIPSTSAIFLHASFNLKTPEILASY